MKGITLTGLNGANPLGFLAALGVLSALHDLDGRVQVSWRADTEWHPVLHTPEDLDEDGLVGQIAAALAGQSVGAFEVPSGVVDKPVADNLTVSGTAFREFASSQTTSRGLDFASAFACDALVDENGRVLDTAFRTMSGAGHQHFLKSMRDLAVGTTPAHIREALFGPWQYDDDPPIMRWDPSDDRRYALRWREPSGDPIRTVRGANRLAIEGLRFFPAMPLGRRLETTGIIGSRASDTYFTWPIWTCAIGAPVIRSLLAMPELRAPSPTVEPSTRADLLARGIVGVFRSQRITVGKFRNFGPSAAL